MWKGYSPPKLLGVFVSEELPDWFHQVVDRTQQRVQTEEDEVDDDDTESVLADPTPEFPETDQQPPVAADSRKHQQEEQFLITTIIFLQSTLGFKLQ